MVVYGLVLWSLVYRPYFFRFFGYFNRFFGLTMVLSP
eukprot:SAG11_NODE_1417_length_4966_cov_4.590592_5_plen_37_part_00